MSFLVVENLSVSYGAIQALRGISLRVEEGEVVTLIGGNGAGKIDDAAHDLRTAATRRRARSSSMANRSSAGRRIGSFNAGWCKCPKAAASLPISRSKRICKMGAYARHDHAGIRADHERALDLLPRLRERLQQIGRHALRRRTADAGDRPGALGSAPAVDARRAVAGPGAAGRADRLSSDSRDRPRRARRSC